MTDRLADALALLSAASSATDPDVALLYLARGRAILGAVRGDLAKAEAWLAALEGERAKRGP